MQMIHIKHETLFSAENTNYSGILTYMYSISLGIQKTLYMISLLRIIKQNTWVGCLRIYVSYYITILYIIMYIFYIIQYIP